MITVVMLLFFPVILLMSLYRLYQLPRDLIAGRKWLNPKRQVAYALGSVSVYAALAAYTIYVITTLGGLIFWSPKTFADLLSAASSLGGYPFVYLAYEWVYHYAFDPRPKSH